MPGYQSSKSVTRTSLSFGNINKEEDFRDLQRIQREFLRPRSDKIEVGSSTETLKSRIKIDVSNAPFPIAFNGSNQKEINNAPDLSHADMFFHAQSGISDHVHARNKRKLDLCVSGLGRLLQWVVPEASDNACQIEEELWTTLTDIIGVSSAMIRISFG